MRAFSLLLLVGAACGDWSVPLDLVPEGLDPVDPEEEKPETPSGPPGIYLSASNWSNPRFLLLGEAPTWSPDGQRLAFHRDGQIWVVDTSGTGEQLLGAGSQPDWSPDGRLIAFVSDAGIEVMRPDGTGRQLILPHLFRTDTYAEWDMGVGGPAWSPDGTRIAFHHHGDGDIQPATNFVMNADGSDPRPIIGAEAGIHYAEMDPDWSADGNEVVFVSYGYGIAIIPVAGGAPRSVYQSFPAAALGANPVFGPRGATIYFTANRFLVTQPAIWAVDGDGSNVRTLMPGGADPAWSSDGRRVAFAWTSPAEAVSGGTSGRPQN